VLGHLLRKDPCERPESALGAARMLQRVATPRHELRGHDAGRARVADVTIQLECSDISKARTDVIVNAANEKLDMKQGVAGALRAAAGDELEQEAHRSGPVTMGQVIWTQPYRLNCRAVAHATAAADGAICIQRAVLRTLFEAERRGLKSITFPALGTGIGGVPHGLGARLMLEAIRTFASFEPKHCRAITIALVDNETLQLWSNALLALDADAAVP
jgi:O-acetyl-ADP-ribose deacetylase (regulator of RNase III)